ncbi:MAG: transcriptional regulator [Candidatus Paceibacterota bacterium]
MKGLLKDNAATRARKATGLNQEVFASRYRVPLATLRNHEQGRLVDTNLGVYYELIAQNPELILKMINAIPAKK